MLSKFTSPAFTLAVVGLVGPALGLADPLLGGIPDTIVSIIDGLLVPEITEIIPYFSLSSTAISKTGTQTIGTGCSATEITISIVPTTYTYTGIGTKTTTYPCSTATSITTSWWEPSCTCSVTTTFPWSPPSKTATSCATATSTITVTQTTSICTNTVISPTISPKTTSTPTTLATTTSPSVTTSAQPTFSCAPQGYLIQKATLLSVDIPSGTYTTQDKQVGDGHSINALGFNVLDNFLYGFQEATHKVVRINADGSTTTIATLASSVTSIDAGDVDTSGYYYFTASGKAWWQMDLIPGSPTFGKVVDSGTSDPMDQGVGDWVYLPADGQYLWNFGTNRTTGASSLARWDMNTHIWEKVANFPDIKSSVGAHYGINNGTFFASDNPTGKVYNVPVRGSQTPFLIAQAPSTSSNDGARCVLNLLV